MVNKEIQNLRQLAKCWNNLDATFIKGFLTSDFVYASQWVLAPLNGSSNFQDYLCKKFDAIKTSMLSQVMSVSAEMAYCPELENRPCLVLTQITNESIRQVTVLIENRADKISRIEVCFIPEPSTTFLTGETPK